MATRTIPLKNGLAYQKFSVTLDGTLVTFRLQWLTQYGYFLVSLYSGDTAIARGRGLHPGVNLLDGLNVDIGPIYLEGDAPTVSNLGVDNKLRYEELS